YQTCDRGGRNILALLPGSDPQLKGEYVVVGAHYDHVADGRMGHANGPIGFIHNGADDNASGCSALLETIEALSDAKVAPRRSILFAFWDGEEMGMLGSYRWVKSGSIAPNAVKMAINIDMIGRMREGRLEIDGTRSAYGLRRFLSRNDNPAMWLDFSWDLQANSDHWPFLERQIPVVLLHTGLHEDYHRPSDDADKINRVGLEAATRYLIDIVVAAADADTLPAYRPARRYESLAAQQSRDRRDAAVTSGAWPGAKPPRLGISWRTDEAEPGSVYLTFVAANSPAATAGLVAGDRIYKVNGQPFADEGDFRDTVFGLLDASATGFTLEVESRGHIHAVDVQLPSEPLAKKSDL
ncbi:MAG: M20/M25/M40 family metallo-hydrolase, partial [Pirellulales bacterium]